MKVNSFMLNLQEIALESSGIEMPSVDKYAGNPCAEEYMAMDDFENAMIANESFAAAALENVFENQLVALEASGLNGMEDIAKFDGELSTEAVINAVKRGAYNVKIQVKKAISKIWSLVMSVIQMFTGSEGRLKSYGKLFKKYCDRLAKVSPKAKTEEKEISIRKWDKLAGQINSFKAMADTDLIKAVRDAVKNVSTDSLKEVVSSVNTVTLAFGKMAKDVAGKENPQKLTQKTDFEEMEKELDEYIKDLDVKSEIEDVVKELKEVDTDEMSITTAQSTLLNWGRACEKACDKDVKFKKELASLKKAWDKKFGEFEIKDDNKDSEKIAAVVRICSKSGAFIGIVKTALTKYYQATSSNIQGLLADMAKVIAKGTNIGA